MLKRSLEWFLPLLFLSKTDKALAFDPVSVATAAQAAQGFMNQADEAADVGFALTDLMSEVGVDSENEEQSLQKALDRISDINNEARDLQWSHDDLNRSLNEDLASGNSLNKRIRAMKNAIKASKQIATIMGVRPKAGEKAVKIQEIKLNSMMLEELQAIRRAQYLSYLEDREAKLKRELFLREILESNKNPKKGLRL